MRSRHESTMLARLRAAGQRHHLAVMLVGLALAISTLALPGTWSAYTGGTANDNDLAAGDTTLTDNDSSDTLKLFNLTGLVPGDVRTSCITVTYNGTLPATVALFGTTGGTGLDPYLDLVVTRGTISSGAFGDCTNFTADAFPYLPGEADGVVYNDTLTDYPDTGGTGLADPNAVVNEVWTTGEAHSYRFQVTVQNNAAAANKTATQSFTWQATNTQAAASGWAQLTTGGQQSCGVTTAGKAYCWGADTNGKLGDSVAIASKDTPTPVDTSSGLTDTNVAMISTGNAHTCAVTKAGRAYCWGNDTYGQLGNGATTGDQPIPVAVSTSTGLTTTNVAKIVAGFVTTCAITRTGKAYCWGEDANGKLGNGAALSANQTSPSPVDTTTGLTDTNVFKITAHAWHTCAITTVGKAYCWGNDGSGQLGDGVGVTADQVSPKAVSTSTGLTDSNVADISTGLQHACAVTTGGRAYCWGYNGYFQVGDGGGSTADRTSPTAVAAAGGLTTSNVATIVTGHHFSCARTYAGAVACWGEDEPNYGQVGNGPGVTANQTNPNAVDTTTGLTGTNVASLVGDGYQALVITPQGLMYGWGYDADGRLGNGPSTNLAVNPSPIRCL